MSANTAKVPLSICQRLVRKDATTYDQIDRLQQRGRKAKVNHSIEINIFTLTHWTIIKRRLELAMLAALLVIDQAFVFLCLNVKLGSLPQKGEIATHRHILFDLEMLPYCFNVVEFTFKCTQLILSPTDEVPENLSHTHCSRVGCIN